jgi:hypothetical protein
MSRPGDVSQLSGGGYFWLNRRGRRSGLGESDDNCDLVFLAGASAGSQRDHQGNQQNKNERSLCFHCFLQLSVFCYNVSRIISRKRCEYAKNLTETVTFFVAKANPKSVKKIEKAPGIKSTLRGMNTIKKPTGKYVLKQ